MKEPSLNNQGKIEVVAYEKVRELFYKRILGDFSRVTSDTGSR
jgi:hypothetical protein